MGRCRNHPRADAKPTRPQRGGAAQQDPCLDQCIYSSRCLPPLASLLLTAEGSDLVGFHKLSNFQLFNDLDGAEPCRQTDILELTELLPTVCSHCDMIWGWFLYGGGFPIPEQPRAGLDTSYE